ncbi:MAG: DUF4376 domain-containing protein [Candidatus Thorarchaeota archaeon]|jgi:hypothetical protein
MSDDIYTREKFDGFWNIDPRTLPKEVETALPGKAFIMRINDAEVKFSFVDTLITTEITALSNTVTTHKAGFDALKCAKHNRIKEIDKHTDELISAGFIHQGYTFSLSMESQAKLIGTHQIKDDPMLAYPLRWGDMNDENFIDILDSTELHVFYLTAVGAVRTYLDSGTALKDQVNAATTVAAVNAIVDNR